MKSGQTKPGGDLDVRRGIPEPGGPAGSGPLGLRIFPDPVSGGQSPAGRGRQRDLLRPAPVQNGADAAGRTDGVKERAAWTVRWVSVKQ